MAAFVPSSEGVATLLQLITEYRTPGANQAQCLERLRQCSAHPEYTGYLAYILAQAETNQLEDRQTAGLLLKNNITRSWPSTAAAQQSYIKSCLLSTLGSPHRSLRAATGTAVSVIAAASSLGEWPELVVWLTAALDSNQPDAVDGALDALEKICEEVPAQMDRDMAALGTVPTSGTLAAGGLPTGGPLRPADLLMPRLLALFAASEATSRRRAVGCVNALVGFMPRSLYCEMDRYVQGLFALANDGDSEVKRLVCAGLVGLLNTDPERLAPHMREVIQYMIQNNQAQDEALAVEAAEFWGAFCDAQLSEGYVAVLREFMPQLVPVLLTNMAYAPHDDEVAAAEEDEANAGSADREQDLRPTGAGGARRGGGGGGEAEEEEEEEEDEDDDETPVWNLRKCSAAGLDMLSIQFEQELLPILLPVVEGRIGDASWRLRESAVLALGAVAEGCAAGLRPLLLQIIGGLCPLAESGRGQQHPLVRSIACWSLSRFAKPLAQAAAGRGAGGPAEAPAAAAVAERVLRAVLGRMADPNKRVQEAACSSLAVLAEELQQAGTPLAGAPLRAVVEHCMSALSRYQRRSQRMLLDCIASVAAAAGPGAGGIGDPGIARAVLPPLLARLSAMAPGDQDQLPLLECLRALAQAMRLALGEHAAPLFARAAALGRHHMALLAAGGAGPEEPDEELLSAALDAISGCAEGLGGSVESLLPGSGALELMLAATAAESPDVRQSAFALMGDVARAAPSHVAPLLRRCLEAACAALQPQALRPNCASAATNACWAAGELCLRAPAEDLAPLALPVAQCLALALSSRVGSSSLVNNAGIALGRLAMRQPEPLAPHLGAFAQPWAAALRRIRDDAEKEQAYAGLCELVRRNPGAAAPAFGALCCAFASWAEIRDQNLHRGMASILLGYREHFQREGRWAEAMGALEPAVKDKLGRVFGLAP